MANKKNLSFEEAILALEAATEKLESGELTLDESLKEFEEAIKLVKVCTAKLEDAKQRVRILTEAEDGTITDAPFTVSDDET